MGCMSPKRVMVRTPPNGDSSGIGHLIPILGVYVCPEG